VDAEQKMLRVADAESRISEAGLMYVCCIQMWKRYTVAIATAAAAATAIF
jgi:hypothetical protein